MDLEPRLTALLPADALVPAPVLRRFLGGRVDPRTGKDSADHAYTSAEQTFLVGLGEDAKRGIAALPQPKQRMWLSAGGGPGAGKTTAFLQFVAETFGLDTKQLKQEDWAQPSLAQVLGQVLPRLPAVWASPDHGGLNTVAAKQGHPETSDEPFYLKWRWGTNFLSNLALSLGFAAKRNIVHDTTLGSPNALNNLDKAKQSGYYVAVLATAAPLGIRQSAVDSRNAAYFQSLPGNFVEQDRVFGENLPGIVSRADEVHLAWRDRADEPARRIALIKNNATIAVQDPAAFQQFCALYPAMAQLAARLTPDSAAVSELPAILQREKLTVRRPAPGARLAPKG